jgi:parallel beta-helix repeat protein
VNAFMNPFRSIRHETDRAVLLLSVIVPLLLCPAAKLSASQIVVSTTIQAAVDAATPGDTVLVPPGLYRENVLVNKNNITITGSQAAIMDGTGLTGNSGITVRSSIPQGRIDGFRLTGLRIQNYEENGVLLVRVDNFAIDHGKYVNNDEYGIFPILSSHGRIEFNQVSGSNDTGIYIGQSHDVVINDNHVTDCTVGFDVELSSNVAVHNNEAKSNSIGMTTEVVPGLTVTETTNIQFIGNVINKNNRPNPVTEPEDILSHLPSGSGLLIIGADEVSVNSNAVMMNDSVGIAVIRLPPEFSEPDPRINPFPDNDEIRGNVVNLNGRNPDPRIAPFPGSDLIWDFSGAGNCWGNNVFRTSFPNPLPSCP